MTHLVDLPRQFADDALRGFVEAHPAMVAAVPGGVVRAVPGRPGKVAVVVGGGSGHYPAFAGFVGPGFADGAVAGHVFTSPSVGRVCSVARAADRGGGVLLACGNYAGDELNFTLAADRLRSEGLGTRVLLVTDDVASAPADEIRRRRGIAGGMLVFKLAAAAAESGLDLEGVASVAARANAATRTIGVAFGGCTLPGEATSLFEVERGRMALGLGIHGEPGIEERALPSARDLAELLVERLLAEHEFRGRSAAVLLNGLGATKAEELFVLWHSVADCLRQRGVRIVAPEVREMVTSLDMAGCSLSATWLDDELEALWLAPCTTPAFVRLDPAGAAAAERSKTAAAPAARTVGAVDGPTVAPPAAAQDARGAVIVKVAEHVAQELAWHEAELGRLDSVAGDGDHGTAMVRGSAAAVAAMRDHADPQAMFTAAAVAWGEEAGGTSGVLWSRAIEAFGDALFRQAAPPDRAIAAAADAVRGLGRAEVGDKTMLDAMVPFSDTFARRSAAGDPSRPALESAVSSAEAAARSTAALRPRVGRARPLAERSIGHADPGAMSFALVVRAVADALSSGSA